MYVTVSTKTVLNGIFVTRYEKTVLMCTQNLTTFLEFEF